MSWILNATHIFSNRFCIKRFLISPCIEIGANYKNLWDSLKLHSFDFPFLWIVLANFCSIQLFGGIQSEHSMVGKQHWWLQFKWNTLYISPVHSLCVKKCGETSFPGKIRLKKAKKLFRLKIGKIGEKVILGNLP